jgi:hypothetical protein
VTANAKGAGKHAEERREFLDGPLMLRAHMVAVRAAVQRSGARFAGARWGWKCGCGGSSEIARHRRRRCLSQEVGAAGGAGEFQVRCTT